MRYLNLLVIPFLASAETVRQCPEWGTVFGGRSGCFILYDADAEAFSVWNEKRARQTFLPASTFKIPNVLIALETGVATGVEMVFPWDGKTRFVESWNRDHTLRTALRHSVVPIYQEIARQIGEERMQDWVNRLDYGNGDISGGIDLFWLEGGLRISAFEQIAFLRSLHAGKLNASAESQKRVCSILLLEERDRHRLFGKTGFTMRVEPGVAWWVGWVETEERAWFFACNVEANSFEEARARETIARAILAETGVFPQSKSAR